MSGARTSGGEAPEPGAATASAWGPPAPAPIPVDVGIVAALPIEVGFLIDRLEGVRKYSGAGHSIVEGECSGKLVALIVAGMGRASARRGAQLLLEGHRPRWIVSAGFGGALDPDLKRNDVVLATEVLDREGHRFAIDVGLGAGPPGTGRRIVPGRLLTVDQIVRTAAEKAGLRREFAADIVDLETSAVAALCSERQVRFLSIRVVSDEAGIDLPAEVASLITRTGSYQVGAALRAIWHRPSSIKDFWALHEHAQEAADRLATVTAQAIRELT